jgi:hypothetical protein
MVIVLLNYLQVTESTFFSALDFIQTDRAEKLKVRRKKAKDRAKERQIIYEIGLLQKAENDRQAKILEARSFRC